MDPSATTMGPWYVSPWYFGSPYVLRGSIERAPSTADLEEVVCHLPPRSNVPCVTMNQALHLIHRSLIHYLRQNRSLVLAGELHRALVATRMIS